MKWVFKCLKMQVSYNAIWKGSLFMNIGMLILVIIGGCVGFFSTIYIVASLLGTIGYKIYRKARFGISLYN